MPNAAKELEVHMIHPGTEDWKALGRLIEYIRGKYTKGIIIIMTKIMKAFMFCDSKYATDKEERKSVSGLFDTLRGTVLLCSPKNQSTVMLSITEADYVVFSA